MPDGVSGAPVGRTATPASATGAGKPWIGTARASRRRIDSRQAATLAALASTPAAAQTLAISATGNCGGAIRLALTASRLTPLALSMRYVIIDDVAASSQGNPD